MKRKELVTGMALTAALAGAALTFSGCGFSRPEVLYGPPPEVEYDPSEEEIEDVYGPPPFEEDVEEPDDTDIDTPDDYDPGEELIEAVYGPPPGWEDEAEPVEPAD